MADRPVIESPLRQQEKHELQALNKRLEGYIIQLEEKFSGQVEDLLKRLAAAEAIARTYKEQIEVHVTTITTLNVQITSLNSERADFEKEIQTLKQLRRQDQELLDQRAREIQKLKGDLFESERRETLATQKAERLQKEVEYLKVENERLAALARSHKAVDIVLPTTPSLDVTLSSTTSLDLEYKAKYAVLIQRTRASMFDHFKKELQAQHEKWQERYTRRTQEFIEQGRRIGALLHEINVIKNAQATEVHALRVRLSETESEMIRLRGRVSELENDKISLLEEIRNLNELIQKLQEEVDELQRAQQRYDSLEIELRAYRLLLESGEDKLSSKRQRQDHSSDSSSSPSSSSSSSSSVQSSSVQSSSFSFVLQSTEVSSNPV